MHIYICSLCDKHVIYTYIMTYSKYLNDIYYKNKMQ